VHAKLRKEGFLVNHKRAERIWRGYGSTLSARRIRKKVRTGETVPKVSTAPDHVWTYNFVFDATFGGRRMKVVSVIDEFTREALAIVPARSLTSSAVQGVLARLFAHRGRPAVIRRACYQSLVKSPPWGSGPLGVQSSGKYGIVVRGFSSCLIRTDMPEGARVALRTRRVGATPPGPSHDNGRRSTRTLTAGKRDANISSVPSVEHMSTTRTSYADAG
jgi:hypothetical protein